MYTAFIETLYPTSRKLPSYIGEEDEPEYQPSKCMCFIKVEMSDNGGIASDLGFACSCLRQCRTCRGQPNYVALALFGVSTLGLTVFLAVKGDDDYTLDKAPTFEIVHGRTRNDECSTICLESFSTCLR